MQTNYKTRKLSHSTRVDTDFVFCVHFRHRAASCSACAWNLFHRFLFDPVDIDVAMPFAVMVIISGVSHCLIFFPVPILLSSSVILFATAPSLCVVTLAVALLRLFGAHRQELHVIPGSDSMWCFCQISGIDNCSHGQQRTHARPRLWRQCSTTGPVLVNCLLNKFRLQQPRPDDTRACDA